LRPGQILDGKYEILDKIGEGGMGEVYRARHVHLDEVRIIKVTKPGAADAGQPRRFQEEARIATLVRHPNVAALYDFSRQPDGSYYMVWEFIDGVTLEEWLRRRGPLPLAQALEVAEQILAGLSEIHAQGIVHRDLSPDNIMLREAPGRRLQAKIIDLGIAKRVAAESLQMTGTGLFLGKLKYCSPEQAGALTPGQALDHRSDLYSFAVVLYEMVSGKAPFESPTPEGYLGKHLHAAAPPLDTSKLPGRAGPALAAILAKALEKRRDRRYRDAREFSEALARLRPAASEAGRADEPAPAGRAAAASARRTGMLLRVLPLLFIALAAAGLWAARRRSAPPRTAATAPRAGPIPRPTPTAPMFQNVVAAEAQRTVSEALKDTGLAPVPPTLGAARDAESLPTPPEVPPAPPPRRPAGLAPTPAEARAALDRWRSRPGEARARRASEVARMADRFVDVHPDDPLAAEIRERLPEFLRAQATEALDSARPLDALLYFRAYRQLSFAPPAPDLEARIERLR
jgi:serine/threonine-protein kinase